MYGGVTKNMGTMPMQMTYVQLVLSLEPAAEVIVSAVQRFDAETYFCVCRGRGPK